MGNVKTEDVIEIQKRFQKEYPNAFIGIVPLQGDETLRFEVRVASEKEAQDIPSFFEEYNVNTIAVGEEGFAKYASMLPK